MVSGNFVEVTLQSAQFFLVLLLQNLEIKVEKTLDLGCVVGLKTVDVVEEIFKRL